MLADAIFVNQRIGTTFIPLWIYAILGGVIGLIIGALGGGIAVGIAAMFKLKGTAISGAVLCGVCVAVVRLGYGGLSHEDLSALAVQSVLMGVVSVIFFVGAWHIVKRRLPRS